jgi:hypothetical protein
MVEFSGFPQYILTQFIIEEKEVENGHRLFLIKKKEGSYIWMKKYKTGDIPHKYQQNNTLFEAQESIKRYLIEELGIHPEIHQHHRKSFWRKFFRSISR